MLVTRDNHGFYCVQIGLAVLVVVFGVFVPPNSSECRSSIRHRGALLGTSADGDHRATGRHSGAHRICSIPQRGCPARCVSLRRASNPSSTILKTAPLPAVRFNTKTDLASQISVNRHPVCSRVDHATAKGSGHARGLCVLGAIGLLGNAAASAIQPFLRNGAVIFWVPIVNVVFESLMELVFIMVIFASIPFETATRDYAILLSIEEVEASVFQLLNEPFLAMPFFRQPGLVHNSTTATACDDAAHTSSSSHPARAVKYTRLMYQILGGIPAAFYVAAACIFLVVARRLEKAAAAAGHHRSGTVRQGGGDGSGVGGTAAGAPCVGGKHTAGV